MRRFLYKWSKISKLIIMAVVICSLCLLAYCNRNVYPHEASTSQTMDKILLPAKKVSKGRNFTGFKQSDLYYNDNFDFPKIDSPLKDIQFAAKRQQQFLKWTNNKEDIYHGHLTIKQKELEKVAAHFAVTKSISIDSLKANFKFQRLSGLDSIGNILYTGYFTPSLQVKTKKDSIYKYPFYKSPIRQKNGLLPSRQAIDYDHVLNGKGLEIAWSNNLFSNFILQVQGSGIVEFEDKKKRLLAYNGKNGHPYTSIGKHLIEMGEIPEENISLTAIQKWINENPEKEQEILSINESYVFFKLTDPIPKGAANVELTKNLSIAVDTEVIPMGSTLLAEVPILDRNGNFLKHEYRILFAQDRGGAIKGPARIDLYCGIGQQALSIASGLNHYGRAWLILPK